MEEFNEKEVETDQTNTISFHFNEIESKNKEETLYFLNGTHNLLKFFEKEEWFHQNSRAHLDIALM